MAGCGYVCPKCEGRGFDEKGNTCDWCAKPEPSPTTVSKNISDEEWIKEVHEGKCCADDPE